MPGFVIDTHALIWFLSGSDRLGTAAIAALNDAAKEVIVPAIVLAEALWIVETRDFGLGADDVSAAIDADPRISVYPLTREVVERASGLTVISEMHDRQIVATVQMLNESGGSFVLITKDAEVRDSSLVPTVW